MVGRDQIEWLRGRASLFDKTKDRGQAVVEFALVMVFFLVFLLALIDLGRAYFVMMGVQNAAGEGALYGIANPGCRTAADPGDCGDPNNIEYRIKNESDSRVIDPNQYTAINVACDPVDCGPGAMLTVEAIYEYQPILPILSAFGADRITIRRVAIQLVP